MTEENINVVVPLEPTVTEGTPEPKPEAAPEVVEKPFDSQAVADLIEEGDKALAAAETKIVSLKRKLKDKGGEDVGEMQTQIDELNEKISAMQAERQEVADSGELEIQALRKKNSELITTLRANKSTSNNSAGSNQPEKEEEDPTKGYSGADLTVIQRIADRKGMTLREYLKSKK